MSRKKSAAAQLPLEIELVQKPIDPTLKDPTREELIEALERLMGAVLWVSDMPEIVEQQSGIFGKYKKPRTEILAEGYKYRHERDAQGRPFVDNLKIVHWISEIIYTICYVPHNFQLRETPDKGCMKHALRVIEGYYQFHPPVKEERTWDTF